VFSPEFLELGSGFASNSAKINKPLQDFELSDVHGLMSNAIGGDLNEVFKEGNAPTDQGGDQPRLCRRKLFKRGILIASKGGWIICFPDVDGGGGVF
jgi:hypothetical protein